MLEIEYLGLYPDQVEHTHGIETCHVAGAFPGVERKLAPIVLNRLAMRVTCLLYTSDAADE